MRLLEEFWYGNIEPLEYDASPNAEYKELLQLISQNEDKLLAPVSLNRMDLQFMVVTIQEFQKTIYIFHS